MAKLQGGCLCGAVRYTVEAPFASVAVCHCRDCQRQSGAAYSVNAIVPEGGFHLTGETKVLAGRGESGAAVERAFCPACGSPIATRAEAMPQMVVLKMGTLDEIPTDMPALEIYRRNAFPWAAEIAGAAHAGGAATGITG